MKECYYDNSSACVCIEDLFKLFKFKNDIFFSVLFHFNCNMSLMTLESL